ncbi:ABC-three component system protein [uncultured Aquimarina sp.]|uniref:ABC-three component system protein n=1 Tax=uncultured Aquimarina sp. TaxID=575652 RepID=UPI0026186506|nr:ABC-three component system protein [uncultured Aquimarina sp.]
MLKKTNQNNANISGSKNKIIGGDDNSQTNNYIGSNGKLSSLFEKLKGSVDNSEEIEKISDNLKRYTTRRDTIGLERKLLNADKSYLYEDFAWLKQEFHKKLVYYQNYEPAQEIFAFILAIVLEKYINLIKPMLREGIPEREILATISSDVVKPILDLIESEGCDDIIGLSSTEIQGMFHYLTGNCHINWEV